MGILHRSASRPRRRATMGNLHQSASRPRRRATMGNLHQSASRPRRRAAHVPRTSPMLEPVIVHQSLNHCARSRPQSWAVLSPNCLPSPTLQF
ncbi:hypothetical protein AURDEDRAFT_155085 [Auricularia subglabra TFB-10046 SS5]|uniref:Uncharacterized protein n=1 Tax=Auricularia subglabra (strain TFB-10046 / SS5) TaxID=717982 RepID=J0CTQ7_AURST|nr:hypothetical protein AURDEDRAFT_155085 [Auricularia subglabra TFB-10046 SS5]